MKKGLVIGSGSIGIRHIRSFLKTGCELAAYRTKKGNISELPHDIKNDLMIFHDEEEAFAWAPEFIIISNPTNLHMKYLLKAIDRNIDVLVEKPVAIGMDEIEIAHEMISNRKNRVAVGYNLRFHPIVNTIKDIISSKRYGKVLKADLRVGHYLPYWHPYEDYRTGYAARSELGGGVLRTLSHEIDLGQYWFGNYREIFSKILKISELEIDVDDYTLISAKMENGVVLNISMDYLSPVFERNGSILFEKGLLQYDIGNPEIRFAEYGKETGWQTIEKLIGYDYNDQYESQSRHFLSGNQTKICSLEEGIEVLRIISKCEESNEKGMIINVQVRR